MGLRQAMLYNATQETPGYLVDFLDLPELDRTLLKKAIVSCNFTKIENTKGLEFSLLISLDVFPDARDYMSEVLQRVLSTTGRLTLEIENLNTGSKIYTEDVILLGAKRNVDYGLPNSEIRILDFCCSSWQFFNL